MHRKKVIDIHDRPQRLSYLIRREARSKALVQDKTFLLHGCEHFEFLSRTVYCQRRTAKARCTFEDEASADLTPSGREQWEGQQTVAPRRLPLRRLPIAEDKH